MSLEPPSFRASTNPSSTPLSSISSPSPSFNSLLMAAAVSTNTAPHSNSSGGLAVLPSSPSPITSPPVDWARSRSPNPACADTSSEEVSIIVDGNAADVDAQILEALKSKDRLYVLKLGEMMESLINERKARIDLTPSTSYQRLLVHRCSAFYKLSPENDSATKSIIVSPTAESRIPVRKLCDLVPAESSTQPAFKIMRRTLNERIRSKPYTPAGSVAGDEADLSDVEPSESGSFGGRSSAPGISKKQRTIEEREAAYNEARTRIFMDFQEKEKEKEKDMSASSSTQSLVSGSASTSGGRRSSSIDDLDDSVSTPATESEWSGPVARERQDLRPTGSSNNIAGSSRSLRSNAPPFNANGSICSRGSRPTSPAFKYPTLYEPPPTMAAPYDAAQAAGKTPTFIPQFPYGYPSPGQVPPNQHQQAYLAAYPNFSSYSYPPQNQTPTSDPASQVGQNVYMPPHNQTTSQYVPYPNPYLWSNAHQPPAHQPPTVPMPMQHPSTSAQHHHQASNHPHPHLQPAQTAPQFSSPYMQSPSPYGPYPMPGYYPPQSGQPQMPPPHQLMMGQPMYSPESRSQNGTGAAPGRNGHDPAGASNHVRTSSRNSTGHSAMNGGGKRGAPPARAAWSYGPGIGMGGLGHGNSSVVGGGVGPRLSSAIRRTSQTSSVGSGSTGCSTGYRTPAGDEASSTTSSSTSSSRRTYTSTISSQHPLPQRPDWSVGMRSEPTLHPTHPRHHDNAMSSSRSSGARHGGQSRTNFHSPSQQITPITLQPTDFPPLTTSSQSEKRTPTLGGAWINASSTRSILMPSPGHANFSGHANLQSGALSPKSNVNNGRLEEPERGFERPPPKGNVELFNPKASRRSNSSNSRHSSMPQDKSENEKQNGVDVVANVVDQITSLSPGDTSPGSPSVNAAVTAPMST